MKRTIQIVTFVFLSMPLLANAKEYLCAVHKIESGSGFGESITNFTIDTATEERKDVALPGGNTVSCVVFRTVHDQLTCLYVGPNGPIAAASADVGSSFLALQLLGESQPMIVGCSSRP